jgi:cob(I)alamin adenosyltransferase
VGNRLSKIYTRTGDDGTTGLGDGSRVAKDDPRVEAYGCVDECNSAIGVILAVPGVPADVRDLLTVVQHELFDLGGELCIPGHRAIKASHILALEQALDASTSDCRRSRNSSCRAAAPRPPPVTSRAQPAAARNGAPGRSRASPRWRPEPLQYLNRLSDLLFVLARVLARHESGSEVLWNHVRRGAAPKD